MQNLIVEHALLAAEYAGKISEDRKAEILKRLKEIEEELGMTPREIAEKAINKYKNAY